MCSEMLVLHCEYTSRKRIFISAIARLWIPKESVFAHRTLEKITMNILLARTPPTALRECKEHFLALLGSTIYRTISDHFTDRSDF
jgi:hypothetical protein